MAKHYSPTRREVYRATETKRREVSSERRQARRDKSARRQFESGN